MENASKALIIAGAILLSILIIGLGVFIFNQAKGAMDGVNMDQQAISTYNSPFTQYVGTNISGSSVMALCDLVKTHNLSNSSDVSRQVQMKPNTAATEEQPAATTDQSATSTLVKKDIKAGYNYTVTVGYDKLTGLITNIGVQKN